MWAMASRAASNTGKLTSSAGYDWTVRRMARSTSSVRISSRAWSDSAASRHRMRRLVALTSVL